MNEKRAIELCVLHQDPLGFEFLVKKYRKEALYHAVSLMGNYEDAADACQESFSRAFSAIPRLEQLDFFYPWFYRILRNCCLNMLGRKKNTEGNGKKNSVKETDIWIQINPETKLEKDEDKRKIWEVIQQLKPEFREILMLKYAGEKNYEEISKILGIPRGTVMSRLYYARMAFKVKYLEGNQGKNSNYKKN
jgi:RNA polymerase sigma-70 factor (ECF subfamily)